MEFLNEIVPQLPDLLTRGDMLTAVMLIGVGCVVFLIADNGAQEFNLMNGAFVILGYLAGAVLTVNGLLAAWEVLYASAPPPAPAS